MTLILSTEVLNDYGFRIRTAGIRLGRFLKNPVMLWNHIRASRYQEKDTVLAIGYWDNVRFEEGKLMGDPVFDEEDEFAMTIKGKYDRKVYRASSIGVKPIKWVNNGTDEQPDIVLAECELFEVSLTDVPSNSDSVVLYNNDEEVIDLSTVSLSALAKTTKVQKSNAIKMNELQSIAQFLGLSAEASLNDVMSAITDLKGKDQEIATLKAQIQAFEAQKEQARKTEIQALLTAASKDGRIQETQRAHFEALLNADFDNTKAILENMKSITRLSAVPDVTLSDEDGKYKGKSFKEWQREQGGAKVLDGLKETDFATFNALYKADFGKDYVVYSK